MTRCSGVGSFSCMKNGNRRKQYSRSNQKDEDYLLRDYSPPKDHASIINTNILRITQLF
jgi:hypothetical protein